MTVEFIERAAGTRGVAKRVADYAGEGSLIKRRTMECLAMGMIGDGALAFVEPTRHVELWMQGPAWWQQLMRPFADRPQLTRWLGAAEVAAGFWLASRQKP